MQFAASPAYVDNGEERGPAGEFGTSLLLRGTVSSGGSSRDVEVLVQTETINIIPDADVLKTYTVTIEEVS